MQKFIMGLAVGVVAGTLLTVCSKQARELACASKDFANQKLQNAKDGMEDKAEEIKDKTEKAVKEEAETKAPAKKRATKKPTVEKQDAKPKTETNSTTK